VNPKIFFFLFWYNIVFTCIIMYRQLTLSSFRMDFSHTILLALRVLLSLLRTCDAGSLNIALEPREWRGGKPRS